MINALQGADTVIAVTEPTPLGAHDLDLILSLLDLFALGGTVVLNRADLPGARDAIHASARRHNRAMAGEIAMDDFLVKSYAAGLPVVRKYPHAPSAAAFVRLAGELAAEYGL